MDTQELYEQAPIWVQNLAVCIKGSLICKRRYNKNFYEELKRFETNEYSQEDELRKFLFSIKDVAAYREYFTPSLIEQLNRPNSDVYEIIKVFPIIGKKNVKDNIDLFVNKQYTGKSFIMRTSGTTGSGLAFPYSVDFENKQWAIWWQYRRKWGIQLDTWCGWFGGKRMINPECKKTPFWRINKPGRQIMYSSYHLTNETVCSFYEDIKKRQLKWLHGYPSHLAKLASLIIENKLEPLSQVKWVTTGAEGLVGNQKRLLTRAFPNAMIGEHYGQNEGVAIMNRYSGKGWETVDSFSYIEFIPYNEEDQNLCRIVGTGFFNPVFPLVRYDTGDLAKVERDDKGNIVKVISIDGRTGNTIKQPSGHEITEAALSIVLHDFDNIAEAQFHQLALDEVVLWVVKGSHYSVDDEQMLEEALNNTFDNGVKISVKYVDAVERTKAGKLRLVIPKFER